MTFEWHPMMSVDGGRIDADHKRLIELINDFETHSLIKGDVDDAYLRDLLKSIATYAKEHLGREEQMQESVAYPNASAHRKQHQALKKLLERMVERYERTKNKAGTRMFEREMVLFLRDWVINHILYSDLRMRPYFRH